MLDQAQDLLQEDSAQSNSPESKGWSSTFSGRPKACCSLLTQVLVHTGPALQCTLCVLDRALRSEVADNPQLNDGDGKCTELQALCACKNPERILGQSHVPPQVCVQGSITSAARERKAKRTAGALKTAKERVHSASTLLFQLHADNIRSVRLWHCISQHHASAHDAPLSVQGEKGQAHACSVTSTSVHVTKGSVQ